MAEAIYSERACVLKTPHEDQCNSTTRVDIFAQCTERPCDGGGSAPTATMDAADRQLLATRPLAADAADSGAMPVEAAEGMLQRLAAPGDRLVAIADSDMIRILVDRRIDTVLSDRPVSSGME